MTREYLTPTDWLAIVAVCLTAAIYLATREPELRTAFLAQIAFLAGRQSVKSAQL